MLLLGLFVGLILSSLFLGGAHFAVPEEEGRWEDEIGGEEAGEAEVRI